MADKTATEASNDFWLEFKAEKQGMSIKQIHTVTLLIYII
jgi:hypothetical protein